MAKSPDAFRTISEVADWLGVQAHVLRFWESKFTQVKPVKRAGGRRYYRPSDMLLLGGIKRLLHDDGLTIKGVQKILREHGMSHVADLSQPLDDLTLAVLDSSVAPEPAARAAAEPPSGVVLSFEDRSAARTENVNAEEEEPSGTQDRKESDREFVEAELVDEVPMHASSDEADFVQVEYFETESSEAGEEDIEDESTISPEYSDEAEEAASGNIFADDPNSDSEAAPLPSFRHHHKPAVPDMATREPDVSEPALGTADATATEDAQQPPAEAELLKPRVVETAPLPVEADIQAYPSLLTALHRPRRLSRLQAEDLVPLLARLTELRDSVAASANRDEV